MQRSSEALLNIINDILDFSKIEAGRLTLETIDFDLRTTVKRSWTLAEPAQRKGLEMGCLLHAEVPTALRATPGACGKSSSISSAMRSSLPTRVR